MHKTERIIMGACRNEWLVRLFYAFEDSRYNYYAMEYCPGGDFASMLRKADNIPEEFCVYYLAQMISAVDALH